MKLLLWFPTILLLIFLSSVFVCTWSICSSLFGVEFGLERGSRLQFGFGELRQVGHDRLFVHAWINDLLWSNHLHVHTVRVSLKGIVFTSKATFWPPARLISFVFRCLPLSWLPTSCMNNQIWGEILWSTKHIMAQTDWKESIKAVGKGCFQVNVFVHLWLFILEAPGGHESTDRKRHRIIQEWHRKLSSIEINKVHSEYERIYTAFPFWLLNRFPVPLAIRKPDSIYVRCQCWPLTFAEKKKNHNRKKSTRWSHVQKKGQRRWLFPAEETSNRLGPADHERRPNDAQTKRFR